MGTFSLKTRIISIKEDNFFILHEKLPSTKMECENEVQPIFGFSLNLNTNESCLIANSQIGYLRDGSQIATLDFSYKLHIDNIEEIISDEDEESYEMNFHDEFIKEFIQDIYATGRALIKIKLSNTILEDFYLPFGGAQKLLAQMKKRNNSITQEDNLELA